MTKTRGVTWTTAQTQGLGERVYMSGEDEGGGVTWTVGRGGEGGCSSQSMIISATATEAIRTSS